MTAVKTERAMPNRLNMVEDDYAEQIINTDCYPKSRDLYHKCTISEIKFQENNYLYMLNHSEKSANAPNPNQYPRASTKNTIMFFPAASTQQYIPWFPPPAVFLQ